MVEFERNPLLVRQGAAALACIAAAAVAMPVIAERAHQQRSVVDASGYGLDYARRLEARLISRGDQAAEMALAALTEGQGGQVVGSVTLASDAMDQPAMVLQASLRGRGTDPFARPQVPAREQTCLSQAIYYEARGEDRIGQIAVAEVVINRVRARTYPNTVCGVVYQGSHRATGCQFTFTCDGSLAHRPRGRAWRMAQDIAAEVLSGSAPEVTGRATHYHTTAIYPRWAPRLVETGRIGSHIFYRYPSGSERGRLRDTEEAIDMMIAQSRDPVIPAIAEAGEAPEGGAVLIPAAATVETAAPVATPAVATVPDAAEPVVEPAAASDPDAPIVISSSAPATPIAAR